MKKIQNTKEKDYCNNCGKYGHSYYQCKTPIMSIGIVVFRYVDERIEYLMIRRKDTLGFMDFMRGKYSIYNKEYILNLLKEMTTAEKEKLKTEDFKTLWNELWNKTVELSYKTEEEISMEKFNTLKSGILLQNDVSNGHNSEWQANASRFYNLESLIDESNQSDECWLEPEWGFPKGRRNIQENDFDCALRECKEETGYDTKKFQLIENICPFEEIFIGSNYKLYRHKYYLMYMPKMQPIKYKYDEFEISKIEWKSFEECMVSIRNYNLEKKRMLQNIHEMLCLYTPFK